MWELPPFENCPFCKSESSFGLLDVHDNYYQKRCKSCRKTKSYLLPDLDKKVIYLDQFVLSNVMKAATDSFRDNVSEIEKIFWKNLYDLCRRLVLKQIAIFPNSSLHLHESLLAKFYAGLKDIFEKLNGDTSFKDDESIRQSQVYKFAEAWIKNQPIPTIEFNVDDILHRERNSWLPIIRICTNMNFSGFVDEIREVRGRVHDGLAKVFEIWRKEGKKPFHEYVEAESAAFGRGHLQNVHNLVLKMMKAQMGVEKLDALDFMQASNVLYTKLAYLFRDHDIKEDDLHKKIAEFLTWEGLKQLPANRIQAYLFAALARKAAAGQTTPPNQGMISDISMVSTYMPYCDAIFIDNGCAALISEKPLSDELKYKAKIFCHNTRESFVTYLTELEATASKEMLENARLLYGVE